MRKVNLNGLNNFRWLMLLPLCLLFFVSIPAQAQESSVQNSTNFGRQDGLISNNVFSVVFVEHSNSLWFGTERGVSHFDGTWESYSSEVGTDEAQAFPAGRVSILEYDANTPCANSESQLGSTLGSVWAATDLGTAACWDEQSNRWRTVIQLEDSEPAQSIRSLFLDETAVWIGTDSGLFKHNIGSNETLALASTCDEPTATTTSSTNPIVVHAVAKQNGTIWLGTDRGLIYLQSEECWLLQETKIAGQDNLEITQLAASVEIVDEVEKGVLWVGTPRIVEQTELDARVAIVQRFDPDPNVALDLRWGNPFPQEAPIEAIVTGSGDDVWVATAGAGAINIASSIDFNSDVAERRLNDQVRDIAVDSDGSIWFATPSGVTQYLQRNLWTNIAFNERRLQGFDTDNDPWRGFGFDALRENLNDIRDLYLAQSGDVWIATGGGIRVVRAPLSERQETLFIGDGSHIDEEQQQIDNGFARLPQNNTVALAEYVEGGSSIAENVNEILWAGFFSNGLRTYINGTWAAAAWSRDFPSIAMSDLLIDDERVWIGGFPPTADETGLVYVDIVIPPLDGQLTKVERFAGYSVHSLTLDREENLWFAADRFFGDDQYEISVWRADEQGGDDITWRPTFTQTVTMGEPPIISIGSDPMTEEGMWLAVSNLGLLQLQNGSWQEPEGREYLPTTDLRTIYVDNEEDEIWVGSSAGVTRYDGRTWETYYREGSLTNTPINEISKVGDNQFLFGTSGVGGGLSLYTPTDFTPPWVQIESLTGGSDLRFVDQNDDVMDVETYADALALSDNVEVSINRGAGLPLVLDFGDLQTPREQLQVYYRTKPITESTQSAVCVAGTGWQRYRGPTTLTADALAGHNAIEFCARDRAFEYSEVQRLPFKVEQFGFVLPGLGPVELPIALLLLGLSVVAVVAFSYVGADRFRRRRRSIEAVSRGYNPYVSGEPIRDEYMFFGRHDLLQRIVDTLHNNSIMIHGERRIGKTTMLFQLAGTLEEVADPEYWFAPVYIDLEGTVQELFFHHLMEEIVSKLLTYDDSEKVLLPELDKLVYHDTPAEGYSDRRFTRDLRTVIQALLTYGETKSPNRKLRMILLMDEMDVLSQYDHLTQQQLRRIFMRDFATNLGAVVAGIQISHEWDRVESPWYNLFNEIEIEPFDREEATTLLIEPVKEYYTYEPSAIEMILKHSEGRPFRVQQYALESVANMLADNRRVIKLADVKVAHDNIQSSNSLIGNDAGLAVDTEAIQ